MSFDLSVTSGVSLKKNSTINSINYVLKLVDAEC